MYIYYVENMQNHVKEWLRTYMNNAINQINTEYKYDMFSKNFTIYLAKNIQRDEMRFNVNDMRKVYTCYRYKKYFKS